MKSWAAIILAAGLSRRMGQFKPLLLVGGETITDRLISTFLSNDVAVYLVVGYRGDELRAGIKNRNITVVENPNYSRGMFSSVQAGVRSLRPGDDAFFIAPVDIPLVRPSTIKRLMIAFTEHPDRIIYPVFGGKRGHPPLIPIELAPVIVEWEQNDSLKSVLDTHKNLALEVNVPDKNILWDIDTPEDYQGLREHF